MLRILTFLILTIPAVAYSQIRSIDLEVSPIIMDGGESPFNEFKGVKVNVPLYFRDSWSVSPYIFINRRNLNAYDTYRNYYGNIESTVFNFIGARINKDFNLGKPMNFRVYAGVNNQSITKGYFGKKISSQVNPNIGGSVKWNFAPRLAVLLDFEVIRVAEKSKGDDVWNFIERGKYIDGDLGDYEFDGHETFSMNIGMVFRLRQKSDI
jgi:hypothetical protein